jgi:hypothetical protein
MSESRLNRHMHTNVDSRMKWPRTLTVIQYLTVRADPCLWEGLMKTDVPTLETDLSRDVLGTTSTTSCTTCVSSSITLPEAPSRCEGGNHRALIHTRVSLVFRPAPVTWPSRTSV